MIKPRSILLIFAGIICICLGFFIIYNKDAAIHILNYIALLKKKAVLADWAKKLKIIGWEFVKFGTISLLWAAVLHFFQGKGKKAVINIDKEKESGFKKEYIYWSFTLFSSIIIFIIFALIITKIYHPDIEPMIRKAASLTVIDPGLFQPKPVEKLLFNSGLIFFPLFLFLFYLLYKRIFKNSKAISIERIYSIIFPAGIFLFSALSLAGLFHFDPQHIGLNVQFFFFNTLPYSQFSIYALILFPLFFLIFKNNYDLDIRIQKALYWIIAADYAYIFLFLFLINVFKPDTIKNIAGLWHVGTLYYPMTQVYLGVPMLVNGFTNMYGLYPHFLAPIFLITGLDVFKFSIVISLLLCLSFGFLLVFLLRNVNNKIIAYLGFTTVLFIGYIYGKIATWDYYFQYHPMRYMFPMLLLMLSAFYYDKRKKWLYYLTFLLCSLSILWNPDTGVVVFISWLFFICYLELEKSDWKRIILSIVRHFINAAAAILITFTLFSLCIRIFYGSFPDIIKMFSTISVYSGLGFNQLPMPLLNPWNIVILAYIIGFLYAITSFVNKKIDKRSAVIFIVSLVGTGTFTYYEGRSHNWNLINVWSYFFILITIFADILYQKIKNTPLPAVKIWSGIILFVISFSFIDIFTHTSNIYDLFFKRNSLFDSPKDNNPGRKVLYDNASFIKKFISKGEKIVILSIAYEGFYFSKSGTLSAFNPGLLEVFLKEDDERLKYILTNTRPKIFVDNISPINQPSSLIGEPTLAFIKNILSNDYKKVEEVSNMVFYEYQSKK